MITTTTTRLGSSPIAAPFIRMTSFDDERPLPEDSNGKSALAPSKFQIPKTHFAGIPSPVDEVLEVPESNSKRIEYHTGFFLANIILRLYDEFKEASQLNNQRVLLHSGFRPTLKRFRHMSPGLKANAFVCGSVFLFVLYILPLSIFGKLCLASALMLAVTVPILSQFFFYSMPVLAWVFLYFSAPTVPESWRPPISVKILPAIENILYGDNLSDILAASHNTFLDLLAWLPYGIVHFAGPFVVAALVWLFGPPTALRSFAWSFGYLNLAGVMIQQLSPTAPPWYKNLYGLAAAHYGMKGSPGGLARIDELFGISLYTSNFSNSPLIFGAFPSLHSGCSTMSALWLSYLFPKYRVYFIGYVCWLWWSTMYLTHHYFFDLTAGTALAVTFFYAVRLTALPLRNPSCWCRFNYTQLKYYDMFADDPLKGTGDQSEIEIDDEPDLDGSDNSDFSIIAEPIIETV
ncbi:DEKNAAC103469 [Brettanomyces naardenensis]|uniref:DEKNAAC103469 n=1 Tax=Brettanomyces naardenensis TaxID=13370 RepID=A0A448YNK4_BRENA|nr:DEKNAAC103469 [Brettanomyces naardenensis]